MFLIMLAAILADPPDDSKQQIEYLRFSYKANRDKFEFGTFRFDYTRGSSASPSDAESGVFSRSFEEHGSYVFDGNNARYELIADPQVLAAATKRIDERRSSASLSAFRMLTDGKVTFIDNLFPDQSGASLKHNPIIVQGVTRFYASGFFEFPLYLGDHSGTSDCNLFTDLTAIKDGKVTLADLDMDAHLDGAKVCKFSFTWRDGQRTYWIDLNRGSVPLRIDQRYNPNNLDSIYIFKKMEHASNGGWLPRERLLIVKGGAILDRIVVTEIDVRNKPRPSAFQLDFPELVRVDDNARKLIYPRSKTWSLLNLPSRSSPGTRPAVPMNYIPPDELPGEVEAGPPWAIIAGTFFCVGILALVLILRRRKRTRRGA